MANVKRCDRCGWCYEKTETGSSILRLQVYPSGETNMDLCEDCTSKLVDWLNKLKGLMEEKNDKNNM